MSCSTIIIALLVFSECGIWHYMFADVILGTGKTLLARALANECSQADRKVSFFMRKGADCLSKWVGESERQLRLLFEQVRLILSIN